MESDGPRHLVIVPHTHWDREWYRTHEQFRARLVALVDGLLELLEGDAAFRHFLLDGQTIVLDDYLEVRPNARPRLEKLAREGRLAVGPWHVLPDEWLVSGEALIRNLRTGMRRAEAFGGAMRIGYVPDQFGHVGQLPQLFASFGFAAAVLWRGVGVDVDRTLFTWEAPDGTRLPAVYLLHGYGNAVSLPADPAALAARLAAEADSLARHSDVPVLLLMNGSDHERPDPALPRALEAALARLPGTTAEIASLERYVAQALGACPAAPPPGHRGELRSGLRSPLLPGCASARMPQKRSEFRNDRLLTRYLEPLAAWLGALGGNGDPERIDFAWRVALENHPHDSVCGCSIDAVHEQMETRYRRVEEIAQAHLEQVTAELARRTAVPAAGFGPGARGALVVWNPNGEGPAAVEAELELDVPLGAGGAPRPFHLRRPDGSRVAVSAEVLQPAGKGRSGVFEPHGVAALLPGLRREFDSLYANGVELTRRGERLAARVRLGATPDPGFEIDAARREVQAALAEPGLREVAVETVVPPRLRLRFADTLPGHGLRVYRVAPGAARAAEPLVAEPLAEGGAAIENAAWRAEADASGCVALWSKTHGVRIDDALRVVSEGDRGDEYNFDPVPGGVLVAAPERVRTKALRASGGEVVLRMAAVYRVPASLREDREARGARTVALPVHLELRLHAGLDALGVALRIDNTARDHRLRLQCRAPFRAARFEVESAFEVAERPIDPAPDAFGSSRPSERPIGACPQRSFATLHGDGGLALTVANRGLAEAEAVPDPDAASASLALTLLRAVGWLSRADLRLRPGPAGPQLPTPGAQAPGRHEALLSLRLHASGDPRRTAAAHAFAHPPLAFAGVAGAPGPLGDGARLVESDDPEVVVSALEPLPDGAADLRLVNLSGCARSIRLRWNGSPAHRLRGIDLAGRPAASPVLRVEDSGHTSLVLGAWQIATLRAE